MNISGSIIRSFLLSHLLLLCLAGVSMAAGVEISYPPHQVLKPGHWSYLPVELTSKESPFQGLLSITAGNNTFQQEVILFPPAKKVYHLPLFSATPLRCLPLSLIAEGKTTDQKEVCFENVSPSHLLILLVKEGPKNTAFSSKSYSAAGPLFFNQLGPAELPRDWVSLDSYDVLLIPQLLLSRLDQQQVEALKLWTSEGKILVLLQAKESASLPEDFAKILSKTSFVHTRIDSKGPPQTKMIIQKAPLGYGEILILPWQAEQEKEIGLTMGLFQSGLFAGKSPLRPFFTSAEKQNIIKEIQKETVFYLFPYRLPMVTLGYLAVLIFFWFFLVPRLKLQPLKLLLILLCFSWPFTVMILAQQYIFTGQKSPVLTTTARFYRIFPIMGYAFTEKLVSFTSVGRGKNPDLYFKYAGKLQTGILPLRTQPGTNFIWKETKPGLTIPGQEWHFGRKGAFLWEGFIPFTEHLGVKWKKDNVNIVDSVQNLFSNPVYDLCFFSPKEKKIWYFGKLEHGQVVSFNRGKEIKDIAEVDSIRKLTWTKTMSNHLLQQEQTKTGALFMGWVEYGKIPRLSAIEGIEGASEIGNHQVLFIQYLSDTQKPHERQKQDE
ncbi:MAG: hypothetical protein HY730_03820 [Candidatus Tectomicrobia bacterium]|uniref:DUF4350 domain-containing protein n=1 Tax=Tectimicrobiota bacterium TaxID=2528274 RepID=A0A933GMH8_UNCTE|nr:hypothetical protein [Candidatus Tectomicrobia bacterium]